MESIEQALHDKDGRAIMSLLEGGRIMKFAGGASIIAAGIDVVRRVRPVVVIIDKALGFQGIMDWT